MATQFQYTTLAHQTAAVQSIADVFTDEISFKYGLIVSENDVLDIRLGIKCDMIKVVE